MNETNKDTRGNVRAATQQRMTSILGLKELVDTTLVDLNVHTNICIDLLKKLDEQSREKDPEVLRKARHMILMLRKLLKHHNIPLFQVNSLVLQCDNYIMGLVDSARTINPLTLETFFGELSEAIKSCEGIINQNDDLEALGPENYHIMRKYVTRIKRNLEHQSRRLEQVRPIILPRLPDANNYLDENEHLNSKAYCDDLTKIVKQINERLECLGIRAEESLSESLIDFSEEDIVKSEPSVTRKIGDIIH